MDRVIDNISKILYDLGFEVQNTSYSHLIENPKLQYLKTYNLPNNNAAEILKNFPQLFVMHKTLTPSRGTLFVLFKDSGKVIPQKAQEVYNTCFPNKIIIVTKDESDEFHAKWFHSSEKLISLENFIKHEIIADS